MKSKKSKPRKRKNKKQHKYEDWVVELLEHTLTKILELGGYLSVLDWEEAAFILELYNKAFAQFCIILLDKEHLVSYGQKDDKLIIEIIPF